MVATGDVRQVSIGEAARIIGVSRRTIERRLATGEIVGTRKGRNWVVEVPLSHLSQTLAQPSAGPGAPVTDTDAVGVHRSELVALAAQLAEATSRGEGLAAQVSELSHRCADLSQTVTTLTYERDASLHQVEALTGERDYLRSALAAALTLQAKALPEPVEQGRRWRWPWDRG